MPIKNLIFLFATILLTVSFESAYAQVTGADIPPADTTIIFTPVRPLLEEVNQRKASTQAAGIDVLFSGSGWGLGGFYLFKFSEELSALLNVGITGRRNSDEVENVWYRGYIPVVANKVNRLFMFPSTLGVQYRLLSESLQETFRPFVTGGLTGTPILQTPYLRDGQFYEFFQSFGYADWHFRFGAMIGCGAYFGTVGKGSIIGVNVRYYTIPFGEQGLESMAGLPITNFGGVFLSLSVGSAW